MGDIGDVLFFKQKTAYEIRIIDWSADVCSSDLAAGAAAGRDQGQLLLALPVPRRAAAGRAGALGERRTGGRVRYPGNHPRSARAPAQPVPAGRARGQVT